MTLKLGLKFLLFPAVFGIMFSATPLGADPALVYLDPGHGGQDIGARGAGGLLEKDAVLALAKGIEKHLGPEFNAALSRSDDYSLELFHRTETANSRNADLFISLHAGGAFNYSTGEPTVYYWHDSPGRMLPENLTEDAAMDAARTPWHSVQYRHTGESRLLAQFLQAALAGVAESPGSRMVGAPLLTLSSANMPAVLIEIGCLNNPEEEEKLEDPGYLDKLARAIADGIKNYQGRSSDITSIDLHE